MADKPNWTEVPNALMELMPYLPDAECRVMLVIARKTHGYHKVCDVISTSQLEAATGMVHQGVINGIKAAIKRGILKRTPSGHNNGYCYEIVSDQVVHEIDRLKQSTKQTSPRSRPLVVHEVDNQVVHEIDTQKKDLNERKERDGSRVARTPPPPKQTNLDSFNEAVVIFKELSGKKHIAPALTTLIVTRVSDMDRWRATIKGWVGCGYNVTGVEDMLDWYDHPEKMTARLARNKQRSNGYTNGSRPPADLPMRTAADDATKKVTSPEDRRRIMEETQARLRGEK